MRRNETKEKSSISIKIEETKLKITESILTVFLDFELYRRVMDILEKLNKTRNIIISKCD